MKGYLISMTSLMLLPTRHHMILTVVISTHSMLQSLNAISSARVRNLSLIWMVLLS